LLRDAPKIPWRRGSSSDCASGCFLGKKDTMVSAGSSKEEGTYTSQLDYRQHAVSNSFVCSLVGWLRLSPTNSVDD
jgi:hypothetical protein